MAEASSHANEAGFGNTAVRPKDALSGAGLGGAGAAGGRVARGAAAEGRSTAASEQTRMACYRTAQTRMLRKVAAAPEAPARPQAASSAVPRPKAAHRCESADARDVERADLEHRMRIRCAAGAEGARRAQRA